MQTADNTTKNASSTMNPAQKIKQNVTSFLNRDGQADTSVHESINPAVEHEHISQTQRDENQKVVDREIHQDHYHTSTQPIRDQAAAPTTHSEQVAPVETREIRHGSDDKVKSELERERGQFKDTRDVGPTQHIEESGPTVAGEHVHHHVHENIQPVIDREIHQEHVVHTTHPVHEIHENEPVKHSTSVLPEVDINSFQKQGGSLSGRQEKTDKFDGPPRSIDDADRGGNNILGGPGAKGSTSVTGNMSGSSSKNTASNISTNQSDSMRNSSNMDSSNNKSSNTKSSMSGSNTSHDDFDSKAGISRGSTKGSSATNTMSSATGNNASTSASGNSAGTAGGSGVGAASTGIAGGREHGTTGMKSSMHNKDTLHKDSSLDHNSNSSTGNNLEKKGSLIDKLNPTKDSSGHGEPGFMR